MIIQDLVQPARLSITITAGVCALSFYQAFRQNLAQEHNAKFLKTLKLWILTMGGIAFVFSHTSLFGLPGQYLPFGVVPGFVLAFLSLRWPEAQRAFDSLSESQIRTLMSYRTIFGAFLFAGAALELFPPIFAMTAGLGDLLAGWLALAAPAAPAAPAAVTSKHHRTWQWLTHGWGTLDLFDVAVLGTFIVRPWLIENQSLGPSMLLPWLAVPLLLALNLHGMRRLRTHLLKIN